MVALYGKHALLFLGDSLLLPEDSVDDFCIFVVESRDLGRIFDRVVPDHERQELGSLFIGHSLITALALFAFVNHFSELV